jgi:hypothetical protein
MDTNTNREIELIKKLLTNAKKYLMQNYLFKRLYELLMKKRKLSNKPIIFVVNVNGIKCDYNEIKQLLSVEPNGLTVDIVVNGPKIERFIIRNNPPDYPKSPTDKNNNNLNGHHQERHQT